MSIDLHSHSKLSDGSLKIPELVALAKRLGIHTLAISDHDTVDGFEEAGKECRKQGIINVSAVEISGYDFKRDRKAHILGYLMDRPEEAGKVCSPMIAQRQEVSQWIVHTLVKEGYPLSWEYVQELAKGSTNVFKQHIMHALMDFGYAGSLKGELYKKLFGEPDGMIRRDIGYIDAKAAVTAIKEGGGIAVLAHPAGYHNLDLVPELLEAGLDGLEAWHPLHSEEDVKKIMGLAKEHKLILTGGSDFHGMYEGKPLPLGFCTTPREWLDALYERKEKV